MFVYCMRTMKFCSVSMLSVPCILLTAVSAITGGQLWRVLLSGSLSTIAVLLSKLLLWRDVGWYNIYSFIHPIRRVNVDVKAIFILRFEAVAGVDGFEYHLRTGRSEFQRVTNDVIAPRFQRLRRLHIRWRRKVDNVTAQCLMSYRGEIPKDEHEAN